MNNSGLDKPHSFALWPAVIQGAGFAYAIMLIVRLVSYEALQHIPFDTDEATHANPSLELFIAFSRGDLRHAYTSIVGQSFYPPLHSFFVALSYALFGISLFSSRLPNIVMFGGILIFLSLATKTVAVTAGRRANDTSGRWNALVFLTPLFLAATSPIFIELSILCMLELLGCVLVLALFTLCAKLRVHKGDGKYNERLFALGIVAAAITLTKYSFGLVLIPALCLALLTDRHPFDFKFSSWPDLLKVLVSAAVPLLVWIMLTDRSSVWAFFTSHKHYVPFWSIENWLFYPRAWLTRYAAHPIIGAGSVLLAIQGAIAYGRHPTVRTAAWVIFLSSVIFTISTTNEARHMMIAAPAAWFLAGLGIHSLLCLSDRAGSFLKSFYRASTGIFIILLVVNIVPQQRTLTQMLERSLEGTEAFGAIHEFIAGHADLEQPILLYGGFDQLNLEALRWAVACRRGVAYTEANVDSYPFHRRFHLRARQRNRNIDRPYLDPDFNSSTLEDILAERYYRSLVVIEKVTVGDSDKSHLLDDMNSLHIESRRSGVFDEWSVTIYLLYSTRP